MLIAIANAEVGYQDNALNVAHLTRGCARARNRRDIRGRVFTIHFFTHFIAGTRGGFNLGGIFPQRIDKINGGARAHVTAYAYEKSHSRFNWPAIARRRVVGTEQKRGGSAI